MMPAMGDLSSPGLSYKLTLGLSLGVSGLSAGEHREGVGQDRKPVKDTSVGPGCLWVAELSEACSEKQGRAPAPQPSPAPEPH